MQKAGTVTDNADVVVNRGPINGEVGRAIVGGEGKFIRDRLSPAATDPSYIPPERLASYGIDTKTHYPHWARDPHTKAWSEDPAGDRIENIEDVYDGATMARKGDIDRIRRGPDLVLMSIPIAHKKAMQDRIDAQQDIINQETDGMVYQDGGADRHTDVWERPQGQDGRRKARADSNRNRQAGLIAGNSPTSGMSLSRATSMYSAEQIMAERARYRSNGTHKTKDMTEIRAAYRQQNQYDQKIQYGAINAGIGKTTQEKVAAGRKK